MLRAPLGRGEDALMKRGITVQINSKLIVKLQKLIFTS